MNVQLLQFSMNISLAGLGFVYPGAESYGEPTLMGPLTHQHVFVGKATNSRFGHRAKIIGDYSGDGIPDVAIASPQGDGADAQHGLIRFVDGANLLHAGDATIEGSTPLGYTLPGVSSDGYFGLEFANVGDLNGDGRDDIAVSTRYAVFVFAGGTVQQISPDLVFTCADLTYGLQCDIPVVSDPYDPLVDKEFGFAVAAGDTNGDGVNDIIIGAPHHSTAGVAERGSISVFSGVDGTLLGMKLGGGAYDWFGHSVAYLGDRNSNGRGEFAVGAPQSDALGYHSGEVQIFEWGPTALVPLTTLKGIGTRDYFGWSVASGDMTGDDVAELIVGAPENGAISSDDGYVRIYAGTDNTMLLSVKGPAKKADFGYSVSAAGDYNADGFNDLIVGAPHDSNYLPEAGFVQVLSGADGSLIAEYFGSEYGSHLGLSVSGAALDSDGNGFSDMVLLGEPGAGDDRGRTRILFPESRVPAIGNIHEMREEVTSYQITIEAPEHAGEYFMVLGSSSGTDCGPYIDSVYIPLDMTSDFGDLYALDPYFDFLLTYMFVPQIQNLGILDAEGKGVAQFDFPAGLASFNGKTFVHSVITYTQHPVYGYMYVTAASVPMVLDVSY